MGIRFDCCQEDYRQPKFFNRFRFAWNLGVFTDPSSSALGLGLGDSLLLGERLADIEADGDRLALSDRLSLGD